MRQILEKNEGLGTSYGVPYGATMLLGFDDEGLYLFGWFESTPWGGQTMREADTQPRIETWGPSRHPDDLEEIERLKGELESALKERDRAREWIEGEGHSISCRIGDPLPTDPCTCRVAEALADEPEEP